MSKISEDRLLLLAYLGSVPLTAAAWIFWNWYRDNMALLTEYWVANIVGVLFTSVFVMMTLLGLSTPAAKLIRWAIAPRPGRKPR